MSQKIKTSIVISERHQEWLRSKGGISESLATLIEREIDREEREAARSEEDFKKLKPRDRLLEAVAEVFHVRSAAKMAGIKRSTLDKWLANDEFYEQVIDRQEEFNEGLELLIIEAARGLRIIDRSAMQGLIAWLSNHAPNWGKGRLDELVRFFDPAFEDLIRIIKEEFGDTAYGKVAERFSAVREARFATLRE